MLGKRARQPIRRTTSMTEFAFDPSAVHVDESQPSDPAVARLRAAEARWYGGTGQRGLSGWKLQQEKLCLLCQCGRRCTFSQSTASARAAILSCIGDKGRREDMGADISYPGEVQVP